MITPIFVVLIACVLTALVIPGGILLASKIGIFPPLRLQVGQREIFIVAWRSHYRTRVVPQLLSTTSLGTDHLLARSPAVAFGVLIVCVGTMEIATATGSGLSGNSTSDFPNVSIADQAA
jgi:hypothetical protein